MGEKLTLLYLLHDYFISMMNKTDDDSRQATPGGTGVFFKGLHFQIKEVLAEEANERAIQAARATRISLNLQTSRIIVQD
jgi:hypothetical protein